ncbi:MAG: UDP-3-O-(3-hydroxymyristoyl)glucosamine N-acyltransferase [Deltaproteobacteria bacterium]|nr:UDP-3-O-(3-hydroxymyristoyl)glucosamine N-acyltransferase [Deltaproteobacteria bacterium]
MRKELRAVARYIGGTLCGDGGVIIKGVRGIEDAGEGDLTFIANPRYKRMIGNTGASAVIVSSEIKESGKNLIVVEDPYIALAKVLTLFYPEKRDLTGISVDAYIGEDAVIGEDATIHPGVYVARDVKIGNGAILYPGVYIGDGAVIGENSILYPNVTVYRRCIIGKKVILHAGVVVGSDGFGVANPGRNNIKIPQVGIVQIDDECEIGANTAIDRGTLGKTWIKRGTKIDNLVQIAHNVVIGEYSVIVAQVGISGSAKLGKSVIVGGQSGIVGHIEIGNNVMIAAQSGVHEGIGARSIVAGSPHMPHKDWLRAQACVSRLPEMRKAMKTLLQRIEILEKEREDFKK